MEYTIKEYMKEFNIKSTQTVYNKIKKDNLKTEMRGNKRYIMLDTKIDTLDSNLVTNLETKKEEKVSNLDSLDTNKNIELDSLKVEIEYLKKANEKLEKENEELKKEKEQFRYQVNQKDMEIKTLLDKMENLNDRVIGLIEWKSKSWLEKLFNKK